MAVQAIPKDSLLVGEAEARRRLQNNWAAVCTSVKEAAAAAGRPPESVRIIGVTKYVDAEITDWLVDAGCHDLGENRPQQLMQKAAWMREHRSPAGGSDEADQQTIHWHQIGHLQRNKVRRLLPDQPMIHSLDSLRLLKEVHNEAVQQGLTISGLVEVNVSGEDAKTGLPPGELVDCLDWWRQQRERSGQADSPGTAGLHVQGLMAMAGWGTDADAARRQFATLRELRDRSARQFGTDLPVLSMGMSGDYVEAIAEGATHVRVGSRLFEGLLP